MFFINLNNEHVVLIFVPVARCFPKLSVDNLRGVHFDIAVALLLAAHIVLQSCVDAPAVGMPEDLTGRFWLHVEQIHFAA